MPEGVRQVNRRVVRGLQSQTKAMTPQDVSRDLFERRMRQRRAATCVAAARAALADGRTVEAVERLEEACRLDPEALEARLLLEQIRAEEPADLPEFVAEEVGAAEAGFGKWSHWVAAVIAVGALAALALLRQPGADESRATPARERARPAIAVEAPAAAQAAPDTGLPAVTAGSGDTVPLVIQPTEAPSIIASAEPGVSPVPGESGRGGGGHRRGGREIGTRGSGPGAVARATRPAASGTVAGTAAGANPPGGSPVEGAGVGAAPPAPPPPVERPAVLGASGEQQKATGEPTRTSGTGGTPPTGATSSAAPASQAQASAAPALPPAPLSSPLPLPAAEDASRRAATPSARAADPAPASYRAGDEEEEIGRTLQLYADAYERLDAAAARRVWPTVDERALARAFAGLQSQGISFERCETEVAGSEARAVCRGRARYVPKVGSREPLTASRQWTFRLRRAGDGWQIASAEVR